MKCFHVSEFQHLTNIIDPRAKHCSLGAKIIAMNKTDKNSCLHGANSKGHLDSKSHLKSKIKIIFFLKKAESGAREKEA